MFYLSLFKLQIFHNSDIIVMLNVLVREVVDEL